MSENYLEQFLSLIEFDSSNWKFLNQKAQSRSWQSNNGDMLHLSAIETPKSILECQTNKDQEYQAYQDEMRDFYKAGLLEYKLIPMAQSDCPLVILKKVQPEGGYTYIAVFTIPLRDYSFRLSLICREKPPVGAREKHILSKLKASGEVYEAADSGQMQGWYLEENGVGSSGEVRILRNKSDDIKYDADFPEHPLSRTRKQLKTIVKSFKIPPEVFAHVNNLDVMRRKPQKNKSKDVLFSIFFICLVIYGGVFFKSITEWAILGGVFYFLASLFASMPKRVRVVMSILATLLGAGLFSLIGVVVGLVKNLL